jgi:hypothetical protein
MAYGAARTVEGRPESFLGCFDLEEVVKAEPEFLELGRRQAGQRIARLGLALRQQRAAGHRNGC